MSRTIFIVTETTDYELVNQYAYITRSSAMEKYEELSKKLFEDSFIEVIEKQKEDYFGEDHFKEGDTYLDYQGSTPWWDDDWRSSVFIEEVILEEKYNGKI